MKILLPAFLAIFLSACANQGQIPERSETVLPLHKAWFDGRTVEYVTTDISDAGMARMLGVNYVPRLRDAIRGPGQGSLVERVYKFAGDEQITIFQSAPTPAGAANQDQNYSPLWRVVLVRWLPGKSVRVLTSEEAVLTAQDKGEVALEETQIVINCPVIRGANGQPLQGVR